jgi:tyrosyl-tRNA synthetase
MGGADQWGNITAGLELIRRTEGAATGAGGADAGGAGGAGGEVGAHGLAYPLFTDPSGAKFGKTSEGTSVWLDPARTSPYAFYQYWLATEDADLPGRLRYFTLLPRNEIEALEAAHAASPEARAAQRALALEVTARVHGADAAEQARAASAAAFSREPIRDAAVLSTLFREVDGFTYGDADVAAGLVPLLVATGTFSSNGEARRTIVQGGLTINDQRLASPDAAVPAPIAGEWLVVRIGKKRLRVGRRQA